MSNNWRVLVLSCGQMGGDVAAQIGCIEQVGEVLLVTAPWKTRPRSTIQKVRRLLRMEGPAATARRIGYRLLNLARVDEAPYLPELPGKIEHRSVSDFHSEEAAAIVNSFSPHLGVLAGTYILQPDVFDLTAHGSINLHCGKVPDYRGSAPGFWELFNGETEVGITIHQVTRELDAGDVLNRMTVPLDRVPAHDPIDYIEQFRSETLEPAGIRLLVQTVDDIVNGRADSEAQDQSGGRTWPAPDYSTKQELRRRVEARRLKDRTAA